MAGEIEARLKALDLVLPEAKTALGSYVPYLYLNGQLVVSGQLPLKDGKLAVADHPKVLNGASDLMVEILGNKGLHTRIAVGCACLPLNAAVEVDAIFAVD